DGIRDFHVTGVQTCALPIFRERGQQMYEQNCATCHQADGAGVGTTYPPLAGSDYIQDKATHIDIVLNGLSGPITVKGQAYNGVRSEERRVGKEGRAGKEASR